mmetsp:Transcript_26966/g.50361  ORF Transcript_26966/g.50361 Transcript_26966/m.50361 type:complete len:160 (+) Transcript_26966:22-501(+)|eukprot:CAMPEP_0114442874 /NCGR_PEP_ID=MMETSP0103-20121206/17196_1 /TAXON_ID=37642 ORGANISM="Paraphysomonas imperforata, Strain PA2" /NCGR_SAMPLE_ID=MMETSP0103 /ASSEMBLY_ACC=CAM_ASM_000201 /LENGTH=159 /DNA_ID=CAMNT_0001614195 /DNA_START=13 /DNA_END=492 /DNA_ORIENTATION=+
MKTAEEYERFVVDVLKPQLASFVKNCEDIREEQVGYDEARAFILTTQERSDNQKPHNESTSPYADQPGPLIDMGENCFVQSEIIDTQHFYLHIGMGFHVSLPHDEALVVINDRQKILKEKLVHLQSKCEEVAAYINEILPIINELQRIKGLESNQQASA